MNLISLKILAALASLAVLPILEIWIYFWLSESSAISVDIEVITYSNGNTAMKSRMNQVFK